MIVIRKMEVRETTLNIIPVIEHRYLFVVSSSPFVGNSLPWGADRVSRIVSQTLIH